MENKSKKEKKSEIKPKKPYKKPKIESEDLTVYGAACNGTARGGRKASTTANPACNADRLTS